MEIKLKWKFAKGNFETKTLKLIDIPARGIHGEYCAEIAIKDGMNMSFAEVHLGDVDSSNALAREIVRRWNEFPEELKK